MHEALLTAWPRLARWLEDDAAGRAVRRHLVPRPASGTTAGSRTTSCTAGPPGRGPRLGGRPEEDLAPVEQRFLAASKDRSDAELTDARDRLRREVGARRRTRRLALGLAAVLVVALVATVLAVLPSGQQSARPRPPSGSRSWRMPTGWPPCRGPP